MRYHQYLFIYTAFCFAQPSYATVPMTDEQIVDLMLKSEKADYQGTCLCPYDIFVHNGKEVNCGDNSQYFTYRVRQPKCFAEDIKRYEITDYRQLYDIPNP